MFKQYVWYSNFGTLFVKNYYLNQKNLWNKCQCVENKMDVMLQQVLQMQQIPLLHE